MNTVQFKSDRETIRQILDCAENQEPGEVEWIEDDLRPADLPVRWGAFLRLTAAVTLLGCAVVLQGIALFILWGALM